jgi:hemicentin
MDEAGLPEESHESLKVLHYHLDRQEVSFVAITNHMLDAAKTNRAVCLFRPEATDKDLTTLAKGCLFSEPYSPASKFQDDLELVVKLCPAFSKLMKKSEFNHFFGLRDFIHFLNYLRRKRGEMLDMQVVVEALERNFNGHEQFDELASMFLNAVEKPYNPKNKRGILTVLKDSLNDRPHNEQYLSENEVRYKLIIDSSEDGSVVRLLFSLGVLDRFKTKIYMCSDFPGDSAIHKVTQLFCFSVCGNQPCVFYHWCIHWA